MSGIDLQLFFAEEDEIEFSNALRNRFPEVVFVGLVRDFTPTPLTHLSLNLCGTNVVKIWNRDIYSSWPKAPVERGSVQGPDVLMYHRSRFTTYAATSIKEFDVLTSGSLAWGGGDSRLERRTEMEEFAREAIKLAESMHAGILVPLDRRIDEIIAGGVPGYSVGPAASRWFNDGARRALKVNAGRHLYASIPS
jgi:hypothetical protein